jgi:hypothetical protein
LVCGLLKGCLRKEKKPLFSGCGEVVRIPPIGSRIGRVAFKFGSRRLRWDEGDDEDVDAADDPRALDVWATEPPVTCAFDTCAADPLELWKLAELPDELTE